VTPADQRSFFFRVSDDEDVGLKFVFSRFEGSGARVRHEPIDLK
jgi:hypothetical protein